MARLQSVGAEGFHKHLLSGDTRPDVLRILDTRQGGLLHPFVGRYVLNSKATPIPIAPVIDCFVPIVEMADRDAYNAVVDGKSMRRQPTRVGSFTIRDRRIRSFNDSHSINNVSFYIRTSEIDNLAYQVGSPKIGALPTLLDREHHDPVMFHFAMMMDDLIGRPSEGSTLFLDHVFQAVCTHIAVSYGGLKSRRPLHAGGLSPRQESRVKDLLLANLQGNVSLECLAASCGLSAHHFARAFKHSTGFPPHRWLLMRRVERVQSLLQDTSTSISDIADICGFADQSHLTRVFSKMVGVSPGNWRRERRS